MASLEAAATDHTETFTVWEKEGKVAIVKTFVYKQTSAGQVDVHYLLTIADEQRRPPELVQLSLMTVCNTETAVPVRLFHSGTTRARLIDGRFVKYSDEDAKPVNLVNLSADKDYSLVPASAVCSRIVGFVNGQPRK